MVDDAPDEATARAALQGKRVALGVVMTAAVAFILATALHVIPAVFGAWVVPVGTDAPGEANCALGLRNLERALDRGDLASPSLAGEREVVETACAQTPEGLEAWASFERLRVGEEQLKSRDPGAVAQLKRDLATHLPSDSR
jgi:hypothetical protein